MRQACVGLVGALAALSLTGCGHSHRFTWDGKTLTVPAGSSAKPTNVLGITRGTSITRVQHVFGPPQKDRHFVPPLGHCWLYSATQKGANASVGGRLDYVYFCFGRGRRVTSIAYGLTRG